VSDARLAGVMAQVLARRGTSALVFRGEDGLDELTVTGPSRLWEVRAGAVEESLLSPEDVGLSRAPAEALRGADAEHNAGVARRVLAGEPGPVRDAVLLNAAAALVALDAAAALVALDAADAPGATGASLPERLVAALGRAADSLDAGSAAAALDRWVSTSKELAAGG
jgi:anthranilate phosphoribosyltransferase